MSAHSLLTPGTPVYGALKTGALASVFGLQYVVRRRARRRDPDLSEQHVEAPVAATHEHRPHPRSKKKKRRRR